MKYRVLLFCLGVLGMGAQAQAFGTTLRAAAGSGSFELDEDAGMDAEGDLSSADFRAAFQVNEHVFLRGQYMHSSGDEVEIDDVEYDADIDWNTMRLGAGYGGKLGAIRLYGVAEYIDLDFKVDGETDGGNGWGVTIGIGDQGSTKLLWSAELSVLDVEGTSGMSIDSSIGYRITPLFGVLIGAQSYTFEEHSDELSLFNLYLGLQLAF